MTCARCGHKAKTLADMADHMATVHHDPTLQDRLTKQREEKQ